MLSTAPFQVPAGEERFLCYAFTLDEDTAIDRIEYEAKPVVHHLMLARTLAPEPDGLSECPVLFRTTWQPLFGAGTSDAAMEVPEGAGHVLPAGTQLLFNLHLLNTSTDDVTETVAVRARRARTTDLRRVGLYTIGNPYLELPPLQSSTVEALCEIPRKVEIFAVIPHMHYLGTRMTIDVGETRDSLERVFVRDPYDFDDQSPEPIDLTLMPGQYARVTCDFDNPHDEVITFGESSRNEMCYMVGFALDTTGFDSCEIEGYDRDILEVPRNPEAGTCGEHAANELGVGAPCRRGASDCPNALSCTADLSDRTGDDGLCIKLACTSHEDCGGGDGVCCTPTQGGGALNICIHEACRELTCAPVSE